MKRQSRTKKQKRLLNRLDLSQNTLKHNNPKRGGILSKSLLFEIFRAYLNHGRHFGQRNIYEVTPKMATPLLKRNFPPTSLKVDY